jgi:hypothetical protein
MNETENRKKIQHIIKSITLAQNNKSKINKEVLDCAGFSSIKIRHLLNNILDYPNSNYLEIGVFMGSTFVSALYQNTVNSAYAIDNWSEFQEYGNTKNIFKATCNKFNITNYQIFETDCFKLDLSHIKEKINVFFYDGNHDEINQYKALEYYYPVLADEFIFMVDDFDEYDEKWAEVKRGTLNSIKNLKLEILYENHLHSLGRNAMDFWWNGFYVSYLRKH